MSEQKSQTSQNTECFWPAGTDPAHAITVIAEACEENAADWSASGCSKLEAIAFARATGRRARDILRLLQQNTGETK